MPQKRTEERIPCGELEVVEFELNGPQIKRERIPAVLTDKSPSGLGIYTKPLAGLAVATQIILNEIAIYEVRWIQQLSDQIQQMGLRLVSEIA